MERWAALSGFAPFVLQGTVWVHSRVPPVQWGL